MSVLTDSPAEWEARKERIADLCAEWDAFYLDFQHFTIEQALLGIEEQERFNQEHVVVIEWREESVRAIKYRAWDKKSKAMREVDSIAFHNKRSMFDFDDSNLPKLVNVWGYDVIEQKDIILQREMKDVILIEYTGLTDRNGKEIYEGDIWSEGKSIGLIIYKDDGFEIEWKHNPEFWSETLKYHVKYGEVIDNIYVNPELIKR